MGAVAGRDAVLVMTVTLAFGGQDRRQDLRKSAAARGLSQPARARIPGGPPDIIGVRAPADPRPFPHLAV